MVHFTFDHIYPIYPPLYLGCLEQPCRNILWTSESTPVDRCVQPFLHFPVSLDDPNTMNPFFSDGTISISTSTTKKTSKKKSPRGISWYLAQRRSIGVGWNHPTTRMAYRQGQHRSTRCSQSQLRQAVAAALSWAAGGKGSEESAGVTWPKRDRCVFIYILSYIYIYYFTSSDPHHGISRHIKAY